MFGKILVFAHLGLSLTFAAWALALYTSRVDWTNSKGAAGQPDGLLLAKINEYNGLAASGVRPADARFRDSRGALAAQELKRPHDAPWHRKQLEFLVSGAVDAANPIRVVKRDPDGNPIVVQDADTGAESLEMEEPENLKTRDGEKLALQSLDAYAKAVKKSMKEETDALLRRHSASVADKEATDKLKGPKGLQARLNFEAEKQDRLRGEHGEIRPGWLNATIEYQNLKVLGLRLADRLKELESLRSKGDKEGR